MEILNDITLNEIKEKWLAAFATNIEKKKLEKYVLGEGSYLWHIFSYEFKEHKSGKEAEDFLEKNLNCPCYIFTEHEAPVYSFDAESERFPTEEINVIDDVYIVSEDFSWTYVNTHEEALGPYFASK